MNKRTEKLIKKMNTILQENYQCLRIVIYKQNFVQLSNGLVFTDSANRQKIYNRILNQKIYRNNLIKLYENNKNKENRKTT